MHLFFSQWSWKMFWALPVWRDMVTLYVRLTHLEFGMTNCLHHLYSHLNNNIHSSQTTASLLPPSPFLQPFFSHVHYMLARNCTCAEIYGCGFFVWEVYLYYCSQQINRTSRYNCHLNFVRYLPASERCDIDHYKLPSGRWRPPFEWHWPFVLCVRHCLRIAYTVLSIFGTNNASCTLTPQCSSDNTIIVYCYVNKHKLSMKNLATSACC